MLGWSQNRNAIASGRVVMTSVLKKHRKRLTDPTLSRYGSDRIQVRRPTFRAKRLTRQFRL